MRSVSAGRDKDKKSGNNGFAFYLAKNIAVFFLTMGMRYEIQPMYRYEILN